MSAPIKPIAAVDVPLPELERQMARNQAVACLLVARLHTSDESEQAAYALDVRLIEDDAAVATDDSYPGWAEHIAALQAANPRQNARKEASS